MSRISKHLKRTTEKLLFIAYSDENTYGNVAESKYIDRKVFNDFGIKLDELVDYIGEVIDCEFNPKQKIVGITV